MKILISTKNWIGDAIFAEPLIRHVKLAYPQSVLVCATPERCLPVFEANPFVNEVIIFDDRTTHRGVGARLRFIKQLRKYKFDKVYLLHRSFSRAVMMCLAGIPERIGYASKGRRYLLTTSLPDPEAVTSPKNQTRFRRQLVAGDPRKALMVSNRKSKPTAKAMRLPLEVTHDANLFLRLINDAAVATEASRYRFYFSATDLEVAKGFLAGARISAGHFVLLNPGANWEPKRWPPVQFAALADAISKKFGFMCVITGSPQDVGLGESILAKCNSNTCISFCGRTTLRQLGALASLAKLVVSADSGPMHIASGVGASLVALFGPTSAERTGPYGTGITTTIVERNSECSKPCFNQDCRCLERLSVERVLEAVVSFLSK